MARRWIDAGARRLHLVDLNGAFAGKPVNEPAIKSILREVGDEIPVQLGGGIRDLDTIERYLDDGISYVIIGTAAVKSPGFLKDACSAFGGHIIVGLDAKDGKVATDGWSKLTGHEVIDLAKKFEDYGVEGVIYTDIGRDGMLTGINIDATVKLAQALTHSGHRLGRVVQPGRRGAPVRGGERRRHRRHLRALDLHRRTRLRPGPGARRRAGRRIGSLTSALHRAGQTHHSLPGRDRRTRRQGRQLRRAARCRRPCRDRRALQRAGRRRADLPGHHRHQRRPRPDPAHHRGGGLAGLHSAHRRRRRAHGGRRAPAAQRRGRQGQLQLGRGGQPAGHPRCIGQVRRAVHRRRHRRQASATPVAAGMSTPTAGATTPGSMRCSGPPRWPRWAPARSCSPAWTATAPRAASTWT